MTKRISKKCLECGSPYYREYDIIGARARVCRICDFYWDDTDKEVKELKPHNRTVK